MVLVSTSAAGVRYLLSVKEGRGLKRSAREAGVGMETGYRWLRESYLRYRRDGKTIAETGALLGVVSARAAVWDRRWEAAGGTTFASTLKPRRDGPHTTPGPVWTCRPALLELADRRPTGGWTADSVSSKPLE
jgi:hypothetical protein